MKRKKFIITAAASAAVVVSAPILYRKFTTKHYGPLIMPEMLGKFCDEQTIRNIGAGYRKQVPAESTRAQLTHLLLTDDAGKTTSESDHSAIEQLLETKTHNDFAAYRLVDLEGWIISVTEARQCALFSLT